jgi:multiple sugar transport system permease protein
MTGLPKIPLCRLDVRTGAMSETKSWPLLLIFPSLLIMLLVIAYPMASGLIISFRDVRFSHPHQAGWVGLKHYSEMLSDPIFWLSLKNTATWALATISIESFLGFLVAVALSRNLPGRNLFAVIIFLPYFLPAVVAGELWALMLDYRIGIVNHVLLGLGITSASIPWLADPRFAMSAAIVAETWRGFPFMTLVFLMGFRCVPFEILEAAAMDGAGGVKRMIYVTLPMMRAVVAVGMLLRLVALVNSPDLLIVLTGGGPGDATRVLSLYAFQVAYRDLDFGYSSALSIVMISLLIVLAFLTLRLSGWTGRRAF